ncbi:MAG: BatA and WFA domain-containing protein [Bryobacteraceae bacterium]|nr:BatA and WFA domain-containing protein [Bryobacteraceae bacterium]
MGFLSPWFLAGLAAAAIPVYLHLLRQHKATPRRFSSLMFFERSTQSSIKHRRLRYLALMSARIALLALLALAFAAPYVMREVAAGGQGRKLMLLVVDDSFSMREGNRIERARQAAIDALGGLRSGDEAQVATLGAQLSFLTQPTSQRSELIAALRTIRAGDSRSSYGELSRALRSVSESSRAPLEVHLFSDMQRTSMPPGFADLQVPSRVRFVLHPAADEAAANFTVESVIAPSSLFDPAKARVQATIGGYNTPATRLTVSLVANGKTLETTVVDVPANGRATAEFHKLEAPYGFSRCEVRIDTNAGIKEDDRFFFAVERADPRQLLFVHQSRDARDLLYFRSALESSANAAFRVEAVDVEKTAGIDPARFPVVVLSNVGALPQSFEQKLAGHVKKGGAVLIAAGSAAAAQPRIPIFGRQVLESRYSARTDQRFQNGVAADAAHPSLRRATGFEAVKFYRVVRAEAGDARVIARLTDDAPLLMERAIGQGKAIYFGSTFDNISNDFPLHPSFIPFVEQTVYYLGGVEQRTSNLTVGSFIELRKGPDDRQAVEVIGPDRSRALSLEEAVRAQNYQAIVEGYYELRRANQGTEMIAVNADRREADLGLVPQETLALWQNLGQGSTAEAGVAQANRTPWSLWWYVLLLALTAAVVESSLAGRYLSIERGAV